MDASKVDWSEVDWGEVTPEVVDHVLEQAEKHLEAQLQAGIASDARAITAASILVGLSAAALAGVVSLWPSGQMLELTLSGLLLGLMLLMGAILCFQAARPVDFYFPGSQPDNWIPCLGEPLHVSKGGQIEHCQSMIEDNDEALGKAASYLTNGLRVAIASPICAVAFYALTSATSSLV